MGMFGSAGKSFASDLGHAALNQAGIMFMGRNFDREHEKKAQLDAILGQVLGTSAPGVGTADIVKPPTAMIGRGPGFMSSGQMPGPMQLPPGVTPQMPTSGEVNMPGVASMGGGVDMGAPVKQPSPIGLEDPRLPGLALAAKRAGIDLSSYIDVLKAQQPKVIEGKDGIYERQPDGSWKKGQAYADTIPFGWEIGPDGNPRPRTGGPADPSYIARTAGVRRDAVVNRPMPRAPKAVNPNAIKWD